MAQPIISVADVAAMDDIFGAPPAPAPRRPLGSPNLPPRPEPLAKPAPPRAATALRMAAGCASLAPGAPVAVRRRSLIGAEVKRDDDTKGIVMDYDSDDNIHTIELQGDRTLEVDLTKVTNFTVVDECGGGGGGDDFAYKPPKYPVLDDDETEPERQPTLTARLPVVGGRIEIIPKGGLRPGETPFTGLVLAYVPATGKITVQWDKEEGDLEAGDGSGETTTFTLAKKVEDFRVQQPGPLVKAQRKVGDSAWTLPST